MYIEIPLTAGVMDIVVEIMVEVLHVLAAMIEEIKRSRASEFTPRDGMDCHRLLTIVQASL